MFRPWGYEVCSFVAVNLSSDEFPGLSDSFRKNKVLLMAPSETSFRLIERMLINKPGLDLHHAATFIEALADVFMLKPQLIIVFCDSNDETQHFIRLLRNNPQFAEVPVFAIYTEPLTWLQKMRQGLHILEKFETPLIPDIFWRKVQGVLEESKA